MGFIKQLWLDVVEYGDNQDYGYWVAYINYKKIRF